MSEVESAYEESEVENDDEVEGHDDEIGEYSEHNNSGRGDEKNLMFKKKRNVKNLPVISIAKVRLPKEHIKEIIAEYNNGNQNQTKKANKTKKTKKNMETMETKKKQKPEYAAIDKDLIDTSIGKANFDIYVQAVVNRSKVMESLFGFTDGRYEETRYNIAMFYYCPDNSVYVITTNSAWTLVQNYRDPEFPQRIADRLLTLHGPKDRSNKPLFSEISKTSVRRKFGNRSRTDALDEPHIRLNYAARLRDDASIYKLNCFEKKNDVPVNVLINYGSIRFLCSIKVDCLPEMIEHLHRIYNKEPTRTTNDDAENDSNVYRQYLRVPEFQVRTDLNLHLVEMLSKSIEDNDDNAMENFELMHTKMDDFLDATEFELINKKYKEKIEIAEVPNLKLVMEILRNRNNGMIDRIGKEKNEVREVLKDIYISFKSRADRIEDKLLNFLEGVIVHNHLYYFRAFKNWYYISEDFYRHIQDQFVSRLRNDLLADKSKAQLKRVWRDDIREGAYNYEYMNEENFVVGDCILTKDTSIEIFDLLFYDKSSKITYLYHVKKGFNRVTRVAQDQLCNAALIIRNHFLNIDTGILKDYYEKIVEKYEKEKWDLPVIFAEFDDFENLLSNPNKLVFVYAVKIDSVDVSETSDAKEETQLKKKALTLEKNLRNKITTPMIEESIKALSKTKRKSLANALVLNQFESDANLSKDIFEKLSQKNYIKKIDGSETEADVNSLLLLTTKSLFEISRDATHIGNDIIYDEILRPYRTYFTSLIAKLSVIKMKNQVEGIHHYTFKICEITGVKKTKTNQSQNKVNKRKSDELAGANKHSKIDDANEDVAPSPSTSQTLLLQDARKCKKDA